MDAPKNTPAFNLEEVSFTTYHSHFSLHHFVVIYYFFCIFLSQCCNLSFLKPDTTFFLVFLAFLAYFCDVDISPINATLLIQCMPCFFQSSLSSLSNWEISWRFFFMFFFFCSCLLLLRGKLILFWYRLRWVLMFKFLSSKLL